MEQKRFAHLSSTNHQALSWTAGITGHVELQVSDTLHLPHQYRVAIDVYCRLLSFCLAGLSTLLPWSGIRYQTLWCPNVSCCTWTLSWLPGVFMILGIMTEVKYTCQIVQRRGNFLRNPTLKKSLKVVIAIHCRRTFSLPEITNTVGRYFSLAYN